MSPVRVFKRVFSSLLALVLLIGVLLLGPGYMLASQQVSLQGDWSHADRSASGLAPAPADVDEPVVQVYAARTFGWRGAFGVHTWIATKAESASRYRVYQVLSWRRPTVESGYAQPDRQWYGNPPTLLADIRGQTAARAIAGIEAAVARYPEAERYRVWPGPNSNTFVAWVVRQVPELSVDFPPTAIGKDYLLREDDANVFDGLVARTPTNTGFQVSFKGLAGVMISRDEGIEWNLLGLVLGVDWQSPALKLPGIGRVGLSQPTGEGRVSQDAELGLEE